MKQPIRTHPRTAPHPYPTIRSLHNSSHLTPLLKNATAAHSRHARHTVESPYGTDGGRSSKYRKHHESPYFDPHVDKIHVNIIEGEDFESCR